MAVVVVDVQNDYVHPDGKIGKAGLGVENLQKMLPKARRFLREARQKKIPIVHVQMTEGPEHIAENVKKKRIETFGAEENWALAVPGTWGYELVFTPAEGEPVFQKNSYDVFSNPQVKQYLKEKGVKTLVVLGGYTHACVDSSVRSAVTHGFDVVLATDLVGSPDKLRELHEHSLKTLTLLFAKGLTADEILRGI